MKRQLGGWLGIGTILFSILSAIFWIRLLDAIELHVSADGDYRRSDIYDNGNTIIYKVQDGACTIYVTQRGFGNVAMALGQGCK